MWRALGSEGGTLGSQSGFELQATWLKAKHCWKSCVELGKVAQRQGGFRSMPLQLPAAPSGTPGRLLLAQEDGEAEQALANLARFFERLKEFDQVEKSGNVVAVADYLDALIEEGDDPATDQAGPDEDAVTVSTVHQAKGLEWPGGVPAGSWRRRSSPPQNLKAEGLGLPPAHRPQGDERKRSSRSPKSAACSMWP